ncbi:MAG: hypothetical protein AAF800_04595 [Planctomycetota bacterium]
MRHQHSGRRGWGFELTASLTRKKNGSCLVQFVEPSGKRPTVHVGKVGGRMGSLLNKYIRRAGLPTRPKTMVNCRASCATEVKRSRPEFEAEWIGHSREVFVEP